MKIVQVTRYFRPFQTGAGVHVEQLSRQLVSRGHDVTIYTYDWGEQSAQETLGGAKVVRVRPAFADVAMLRALLRQRDADVIHAHAIWPHVRSAFLAAQIRGWPFVMTPHHTQAFWFQRVPRGRLTPLRRWLWYTIARNSHAVLYLNGGERQSLQEAGVGSERLWPTSNGVNLSVFRPSDGSALRRDLGISGPLVLFVGRFEEHKGIYDLLEAVPAVAARRPDTTFLLVGGLPQAGRGEEVERVLSTISGAKLEPFVRVHPCVRHKQLARLYSAADLLVGPSHCEAFGLVYLEAMACGTPVVATDTFGPREFIANGQTGLLVPPAAPEALAEAITTLLSDHQLAASIAARAQRMVESKYTWERVADGVEQVYRRLLRVGSV